MQSCYAACMPNGRHEERRKRIFHAEWMVGIGGIIVRDRMLWWIVWPEKFSCSRFRDDSVGRNDGGEEYIRDFGPVEKRGRAPAGRRGAGRRGGPPLPAAPAERAGRREPLYRAAADFSVENTGLPKAAAEAAVRGLDLR